MGTAGIFSLASIITITSLMWLTTALTYISWCVVSRLALFYYPYLYGAGKTISSVSNFALSSPLTKFKKQKLVQVFWIATKTFRDL